jgi:hypothetical protein
LDLQIPVASAGRIQENRKNQRDKASLKRYLEDVAEGKGVLLFAGPATRDEGIQSYRSFFALRKTGPTPNACIPAQDETLVSSVL